MTKTITILYRATQIYRERIFAILFASIILVACTYVFLLQKAIINVVQREKISHQVTKVSADVSDLEEKYFALEKTVTPELAHAKGLKDAEVTSYISKKALTAMAPHNEL